MATATANPVTLILRNSKERLSITVTDADGAPIEPAGLSLRIVDLGDRTLHADAVPAFSLTGTVAVSAASNIVTGTGTQFQSELVVGDQVSLGGQTAVVSSVSSNLEFRTTAAIGTAFSGTATKTTRIVTGTPGQYYIDWGDPLAAANATTQSETNTAGTVLAIWQITDNTNDLTSVVQSARIVTARTMSLLPGFRKLIDKAVMMVNLDDECYLGYTDEQLIQYLEEGLTIINAYQPYPTFCSLDQFPLQFLHVLHGAALIAGTMSQQLFAIATDIPNFGDQGNSFVIQHQPQLAAFLNQVTAQMDKLIPSMKLHFVNTGSLHIQAGNNYRMAQLIDAAPSGAVFRNVFFSGN